MERSQLGSHLEKLCELRKDPLLDMSVNVIEDVDGGLSQNLVGFAKRYVAGRIILHLHVWLRFPEVKRNSSAPCTKEPSLSVLC